MTDECIIDYVSPFKPDLLSGKVAFITGGGSGIGFTITEILMRHGCNTVIASRNLTKVLEASRKLSEATGRKCLALAMDVRKPTEVMSAIQQALSEYGRLDIVVNNAAGNFPSPLAGTSFNAFRAVMEIDAFGTFHVSKVAYDRYLKDHGGVILNISATLHYNGRVLVAHAGAAKAAIDAMTKHMATEWGTDGVRVVGIAPGPIENTIFVNKLTVNDRRFDRVASSIPLQRLGTRLEVAHAALFLVADTGSYITGHTLVVDGGEWMSTENSMTTAKQQFAAVFRGKL
jgi:peroxisomal 2,4-dienoyl-CoA reductase